MINDISHFTLQSTTAFIALLVAACCGCKVTSRQTVRRTFGHKILPHPTGDTRSQVFGDPSRVGGTVGRTDRFACLWTPGDNSTCEETHGYVRSYIVGVAARCRDEVRQLLPRPNQERPMSEQTGHTRASARGGITLGRAERGRRWRHSEQSFCNLLFEFGVDTP